MKISAKVSRLEKMAKTIQYIIHFTCKNIELAFVIVFLKTYFETQINFQISKDPDGNSKNNTYVFSDIFGSHSLEGSVGRIQRPEDQP